MDLLSTAGSWATLVGATWLFGLLLVTRFVLSDLPAATAGTAWALGRQRVARRLSVSFDLAAAAVLLGVVARLWVAAWRALDAGLASGPAASLGTVLGSTFGQLTVVRAFLVAGLWLVVRAGLPERALPGPSQRAGERLFVTSWALLGLGVLLTLSLTGHAAASDRPAAHLVADMLHLVAASAWLVGIGVLGLVLPEVLARQRPRVQLQVLAPAFSRFARLALAAVAVLLLTGLYSADRAMGDLQALRTSPYGQFLLVKVWLFLSVAALGAVNHALLVPRLVRAAQARGRLETDTRLAWTVAMEVALAFAILLVTAALINLARPS